MSFMNGRGWIRLSVWLIVGLVFGAGVSLHSTYGFEGEKKPKKPDSKKERQPIAAVFTTEVEPTEAKPGETVTYKIQVRLDEHWHIYKYSEKQADSGPRLTMIDFFDDGGLGVEGGWKSTAPPLKEKDEAFPEIEFLEFYNDAAEWTIKLKVPADAKPGKRVLRSQVFYQICKSGAGGTCSIPGGWTIPDAELTILPGDGKAPKEDKAEKLASEADAPNPRRKIVRPPLLHRPRRPPKAVLPLPLSMLSRRRSNRGSSSSFRFRFLPA